MHVRTRTPLFYISETAGPIEFKFAVRLDLFLKSLRRFMGVVQLHVRT